jgi:hypothetical protein
MNNALAMIISWMIFGAALFLSVKPTGSGGIALDLMTVFMGAMLAALVYIALTFKGIPKSFQIPMIPCINCSKGMPMDAVYCPYCGHKSQ